MSAPLQRTKRHVHIDIPPFFPKQLKFIFSKNRYTCLSGGVGSGKTYPGCHKALMLSLKYPKNVGLIGSQTNRQLVDTTIKTFLEEVCDPRLIKKHNESKQWIRLYNDSVILYRTLDDETKFRSMNLGWFFVDEMTTINEKVFKQLKKRLRLKTVPERCGFGATNPSHPNHWVFRHFAKGETKNAGMINTCTHDNPTLPTDYIEDLESITDEDEYARTVKGLWIHLEGIIYKEFQRSTHVMEFEPKYGEWSFYRAIDWGFVKPFACLFIAVDNDDRVYVFDEIYKTQEIIEDHYEEIKKISGNQYYHRTYYDPSEPEYAEKLRRLGLKGLNKGNNAVSLGIQHVKQYLKTYIDKPHLIIHPRCKNSIEEFESYLWDKDKRIDYDDDEKEQPKKENDHAMDALRYFIHTKFKKKKFRWNTSDSQDSLNGKN